MAPSLRLISATAISRYLRLERCGRFLRYYMQPHEATAAEKLYGVATEPLSPLLAEYGQAFEGDVVRTLPGPIRDMTNQSVGATIAAIQSVAPGEQLFLIQASLHGMIGGWECQGLADIIQVARQFDGTLILSVMDVKASTRDHVEYRLQVGFYIRLLRTMLAAAAIPLGEISGAILKRDEASHLPTYDDPTSRFDVAPYDLVLDQLFDGAEGDIAQVLAQDVAEIPYALTAKCDGCTFNQLCMRDSSERQDIALVPTIRPADIHALKRAGVRTLRDLSELKQLPDRQHAHQAFATTPGKEATVAELAHNPIIAARLDRLVQRARAIAHRYDPTITTSAYLLDASPSQLPGDDANPQLVKIFLDAQHDFIHDRLYLVGALLVGPGGSRSFAHLCDEPPSDGDEAQILMALLADVVAALPEVAGTTEPFPIHLYLYDQFEQRAWLDALSRHLDALCSVPAFYDLLTTSGGGVDELMFTFLAHEIRDRLNLGMTCQNLSTVATYLRFAWQDQAHDFVKEFRYRIFDGTTRREDGVWVEKRSQFNSHIPLEYAYGAWGKLPAHAGAPQTTWLYRRCTRSALEAFALHRLCAMQHIEARLNPKEWSRIVKSPLPLAALHAEQPLPSLARSLEEFLGMEHHAALQGLLTLLLLPFERRVQTGRCLPLRCQAVATINKRVAATFALDFAMAGLDERARGSSRIKEGDWMVLNPLERQQPGEIIRGRIAVVTHLAADTITLDLLDMTSFGSDFKYRHDTKFMPVVDGFYTLDEMADDLNADKYQAAVRHTLGNALYAALVTPAPATPAHAEPHAGTFLAAVQRAVPSVRLTDAQTEVVTGHGNTPLLCVQGPPGTGKTSTLGWAILARIFAHDARPVRVLVCAKTHKATNLVLASVAAKLRQIRPARVGGPLHDLRILKISSNEGDALPEGVHQLNPRHTGHAAALLTDAGAALVVGGTPGGIFTLMKSVGRKQGDGDLPWSDGPFDLLVIDEASQMGLPEAILASAFLKPDAHIIVVGDHRQMPPILAHPWPTERRRTALAYHPAQSIFEALLGSGQPIVRLDESFRLHQTQARFLAEHIYSQDHLAFLSHRTQTLPPLPPRITDPYVVAALRPDFPIVVIEHGEMGSQQFNATEVELIAPIVSECLSELRLNGQDGLGIVVPHNAQKAALRQRFPALAEAGAIDTVERFQGDERDVIIVSATASDPSYILAEASFLLNLKRLNVAFSRPRKKLIVVASTALFRFLCADLELFDQALIWKYLRYTYANTGIWTGTRAEVRVGIYGHPAGHPITTVLPDVQEMPPPPSMPKPTALTQRSSEPW